MKTLAGKEDGFRNEFNSQNAGQEDGILSHMGAPNLALQFLAAQRGEYEPNGIYGVHMEKSPSTKESPTDQRESSPEYLQRWDPEQWK